MAAAEANNRRKSESDFLRSGIKFNLGEQPWSTFMTGFMAYANSFDNLEPPALKRILYLSLKGQAFHLACADFDPTLATYANMNLGDYGKALGELFEPPAESEQIKLEFERRQQHQGEHPNLYFRDKKNLFDRAYPAPMRDYEFFYNKVISGLLNQIMKNALRLMIPTDPTHTAEFRNNLMKMATIVRRRLHDGEISDAEALGAEAYVPINSYQSHGLDTSLGLGRSIKQESINALNSKRVGKCYHCGSKEHFIAQCPRKAAGLSAAVQVIGEERDGIQALQNRRTFNGPKRMFFKGKNGVPFGRKNISDPGSSSSTGDRRPPSSFNKNKQYNKRIASVVVYENEDGVTVVEEQETQEADPDTEDVEEEDCIEGINSIELSDNQEEDYSESGYIPGAFLGM